MIFETIYVNNNCRKREIHIKPELFIQKNTSSFNDSCQFKKEKILIKDDLNRFMLRYHTVDLY